jgi:hydroxyacylglutathione hydrolase
VILQKFPFGPYQTNTILIGCLSERKAVVIDPSQGSTSAVLEKCCELDLHIEKVLITHSHWDHIADLHELIQKTSATVCVHPLDAANVAEPGTDGIPLPFFIPGVKPDRFLENGDYVVIGSHRCQVLHTPGHSPGSVCYYFSDKKCLFTGDTLFEGSIGNLHLPTSEPEKMWESLRGISELPSDTRIIPGHGRDTLLSAETWLNRAKQIFSPHNSPCTKSR